MRVYRSLKDFERLKSAVVTQGTFDGVHLGHVKILERLNNVARERSAESVLLTFYPHPRLVLQPDDNRLKLLNSEQEKIERLEKSGLGHLIIIPFDMAFSRQSPQEFIENVMINTIGVGHFIVGYDHRFGRNREGSIADLRRFSSDFGFSVEEVGAEEVEDITISSTKIRNALHAGDVSTANDFLGYPYCISGIVVKGDGRGKTIGYPTANIRVDEPLKLIPADGVYAVTVTLNGAEYKGMANIGNRPTFENATHSIEVHLFDFSDDLYGKSLRLHLHGRLRGEEKFSDITTLRSQLAQDEAAARKLLKA